MTRYIPNEGEPVVLGPHMPVQFAHFTVGAATTNDVVIGDTAVYTLCQVDEPIAVIHMWSQVDTAFTTNVTMTVGDSTTADRFFADTTMNIASSGAVLIADTGTLTLPVVYSAKQDLQLDVNGATCAAGLLNLYVEYVVLRD